MRRTISLVAVVTSMLAPMALLSTSASAHGVSGSSRQLLALRGHFGGFHLGGRSVLSRRRTYFGGPVRRTASRSFLHRVVRALALAYILHLFFAHGGISILLWILIIALVVHLVRRGRRPRRRYSY